MCLGMLIIAPSFDVSFSLNFFARGILEESILTFTTAVRPSVSRYNAVPCSHQGPGAGARDDRWAAALSGQVWVLWCESADSAR